MCVCVCVCVCVCACVCVCVWLNIAEGTPYLVVAYIESVGVISHVLVVDGHHWDKQL